MVSIIILSYNTKELLQQCLDSIFANIKRLAVEVIVVDNNSHDGSAAMVRKHFDKVTLLINDQNLGFAKAVNQGVNRAKGDYFLLLNSDTQMKDQTFHDMLEYLEENKAIGIIGGALEHKNGSTSKSFGTFYSLPAVFRMLFFDKAGKLLHEQGTPRRVDWVSGGYMLVRRQVFEKLNGFDEHFFMYIEDMELCYRARMQGYQIWYFPKAAITHLGQGSSNRSFAVIQIFKGLLYFYKKHKSYTEYFIVKILLICKSIMSILVGVATNNAYLRSTYQKAFLVAV